MDSQADQATNKRAVDADELQVAPHRILEPVRDRAGIPAAHRLRYQLDDLSAVAGREGDGGAADEAVNLPLKICVGLEGMAELRQSAAYLAAQGRIGVTRHVDQRVAKPLPHPGPPFADSRVGEYLPLDRFDFRPRLRIVDEIVSELLKA